MGTTGKMETCVRRLSNVERRLLTSLLQKRQTPAKRLLEETDLWIGDFWRSVDFPNTDFSLVEIIGENGFPMEGLTEKNGNLLKPKRTISAKVKSKLRIPEPLGSQDGSLGDLEDLLRS